MEIPNFYGSHFKAMVQTTNQLLKWFNSPDDHDPLVTNLMGTSSSQKLLCSRDWQYEHYKKDLKNGWLKHVKTEPPGFHHPFVVPSGYST